MTLYFQAQFIKVHGTGNTKSARKGSSYSQQRGREI